MAERMGLPCSFSGGKRRRDDTRTAGMSLMRELRARAASGSLRHYDPLVDGDVDGCATALHTHYPGFQVLEAGVLPTEVHTNVAHAMRILRDSGMFNKDAVWVNGSLHLTRIARTLLGEAGTQTCRKANGALCTHMH